MNPPQPETPQPLATPRPVLIFVFVTILLDAMSFGLIMPVLPRLLMRVGDLSLNAAIDVGAWMSLLMALAAFFSAPILGNLSDSYGRRRVLLIALAGMVAHYVVLALANSIALIVLGRVLTGVFGGSYGPAQAAIADVTAPDQRARNFALVSAGFGVGFVAGPALGGLLVQLGDRAPFWVALALSLANLIYGLIAFPETLKPDLRRRFTLARANPFGAWKTAGQAAGMRRVALVLLLWQLASLVYPLTWSFWGIAALGWSDQMIGLSLAAVGIVIALSQVFLTGRVVRKLGERDAATVGMIGAGLGFVGYAVTTTTTWLAFALLAAVAVQSLVQPSLMAMLSRRATPETQGEVQGLAAMMMGVGSIIGPMVLVWPMARLTAPDAPVHFPGVPYAIAAVITLAALALLKSTPQTGSAEAAGTA
ncbi:MAG: MFS transporter [Sphingomonadales bacterium]|nr:MFS transporter [Sphingomonadales bacterium]